MRAALASQRSRVRVPPGPSNSRILAISIASWFYVNDMVLGQSITLLEASFDRKKVVEGQSGASI